MIQFLIMFIYTYPQSTSTKIRKHFVVLVVMLVLWALPLPLCLGMCSCLTFLSLPVASKHWVFLLTEVSDSKVAAILNKFVSEEARNSILNAAFLKLYLTARLCLFDFIPSNTKLAGRRKTCDWPGC